MKKSDIEKLIVELETAALEKWNHGDPSGYLGLYDEQITYFDPSLDAPLSGLDAMTEYYQAARGNVRVDRYDMSNVTVQVHAASAVLTYNLDSYCGDKVFKWNCTEVYREVSSGVWKIYHNHWSFVKPGQ